MKVVHVVTAFPRHDDDLITPWLGDLVLAQRGEGVDARVLAPTYRGGGTTRWRGIPVRRFRYAPRALETLTHEETVPDRIRSRPAYAALLPAYMVGGTIGALSAGRDRPDIVHVHWPFPHAWFGAVARAVGGSATALVCSFYSVELRWVGRRMPALRPLLRWSIETADAVTAISSSTASEVHALVPREVRVIPFAAAVSGAVDERPVSGVERTPTTLLFVGRLVERKGVEVLIRALPFMTEHADLRLVVIGEGPERARLEAQAARSGVTERVEFRGRVPHEELLQAYRDADVFILPAVVDGKGDTEGLGVVLLEALRMGVPVVASDAGGIPDIVRDGETGWLVPPGETAPLARAVQDVLARPDEARRRVAAGRRLLDRRFSLDGIVAALGECYAAALARRAGHGP